MPIFLTNTEQMEKLYIAYIVLGITVLALPRKKLLAWRN